MNRKQDFLKISIIIGATASSPGDRKLIIHIFSTFRTICLTPAKKYNILHELISAIYVSAPDKSSGRREQHIRIEYNGIGFIPIHELMAKQTA